MTEVRKRMKLGAIAGKNRLWILLIMSFLTVMYVTIIPVYAEDTVISVPIIFDTDKTAGSTLSVDVSVEDVEKLFAYEFRLYYNATVLTATSASSYNPFTFEIIPPIINDIEGYVYVAYSMPMGEQVGFSTVDPEPLVKIDFTVNMLGYSSLQLKEVRFTEPVPKAIPYIAVGGLFSNVREYIDTYRDDYYDLLDDYNSLSDDYDALSANFNDLTTLYNSLQTNYTNLQGDYDDLESEYDTLTDDLDTTRNLNYIFTITTVVFIGTTLIFTATTAYLAIRKPK